MVIPVLQAVKLSLTLTVDTVLMAVVHFQEKTHQKLTDQLLMLHVILQRILLLQVFAIRHLIQVAYAIGVADPVGLYVNTYGTAKVKDKKGNVLHDGEIALTVNKLFDMRPYSIVQRFGLKNPVFLPTASYGHFGRESYTKGGRSLL